MDGNGPATQPTAVTASASPGASPAARRRMGITDRLRWSFLLTSTVPLILVGALLITVLFQVQQRNAYASQQALADKVAGNIATFLYDLEQQLLRSVRDLRPDVPLTLLPPQLTRLVNSSPDLRAISVVDAEGRLLASATSELLGAQGIEPAPIDQALLETALSVGQGGRSTIRRGSDNQPLFHIVLPIREPGSPRIRAALAAEVSATRVRQILRVGVLGQSRTVYLIDPTRAVQLSDALPSWRPPIDLDALFVEGQSVGEYVGGDGQRMMGARAPVAPVTATSWSVVVEQPASEFFTEAYRSALLLAALVALVGVIGVSAALVQARRLITPIDALTVGARELAGGQLDHRIDVEPGDELGQLASTFNDMAERLQGSLREIAHQNERLRHGLVLARDIQQGLLPSAPPWRNELLSVAGRSLPASEVGGDFYSYLVLPDGRAAVAIGDISGKGVAAALLMALTSSTLESLAYALDHPAAMLRTLHEALRHRLQANQMNAALLIAVFAADARSVTVANAGMIAPLLLPGDPRDGRTPQFVEVGGLPLGTPLGGNHAEVTVPLQPGDTLLLLSDGIVEAHNRSGALYGFDRLEALVGELPGSMEVGELVRNVIGDVLAFVDGAEPHDDITMIAVRPTPRPAQILRDPYAETLAGLTVAP